MSYVPSRAVLRALGQFRRALIAYHATSGLDWHAYRRALNEVEMSKIALANALMIEHAGAPVAKGRERR